MDRKHVVGILHDACREGEFQVVKWLVKKMEYTADSARTDSNALFLCACLSGNIDLVEWIINTFKLTRDEITANNNIALAIACQQSHLHLASWLYEQYKIELDDCVPVLALCQSLSSIRWLIDHFDVSMTDIHNSGILSAACKSNDFDMVQFILTTFKLSTMRVDDLVPMCLSSNIDVVRFVVDHIKPTDNEFRIDSGVLFKATMMNTPDVVSFIFQRFNINADEAKIILETQNANPESVAWVKKQYVDESTKTESSEFEAETEFDARASNS